MCEWGSVEVFDLPEGMRESHEPKKVYIDTCIVKQIEALWAAGIETSGCCCGHGNKNPSVVVVERYSYNDITRVVGVLDEHDDRSWDVIQWRPVTVTTVGKCDD